jgi:quercetin dioxygenase-like cupin family protein
LKASSVAACRISLNQPWKARQHEIPLSNDQTAQCSDVNLSILGTALVPAFGAQPIQSARAAESAIVAPLMLKELADLPGKEMLMITVDYPPGASDPVHRHDAHAFVYVLQGSIVMQVRGGKEVTLVPGQTFYEGPDDVQTAVAMPVRQSQQSLS